MALNDISVRPSLQQISIQDSHILYYGAEGPDPPQNHVRRSQSHVLRASPSSTVIWPGEYIDIQLALQVYPDSILALEPRPDCARSTRNWPHPNIVEAVAGHVRILNDTTEPQHLARHEHFCQVLPLSSITSGESTPISAQSTSWSQKHGGFLTNHHAI